MKRQNWYCLINADSVVLATYGAALGDEAQAKAREVATVGPVALRLVASVKRPSVGARLKLRSISIAFIASLLLLACGQAEPADAPACELRPTQAVYANVAGWAYYNCPADVLPLDGAQCARFREPTNDPERPATWACDRPGNGSVLLAAISEANDPNPH